MKKIIILSIFTLFSFKAFSQHGGHQEHEHSNCNGHHQRNEFGLSGGAIYTLDHKQWGGSVHLHYFRTFSDHSKWSAGGFFETAWADGPHYAVGAGIKYQLTDRFSLGVSPGIVITTHDDHSGHDHNHGSGNSHDHGKDVHKVQFAVHFEAVYDLIHLNNFHLGPAVDFSWSKNDSHLMLGIHTAICF